MQAAAVRQPTSPAATAQQREGPAPAQRSLSCLPSQPLLPWKVAVSSPRQFGDTGNHSGVITSLLPWRSSLVRSHGQLITPITS